MSGGYPRSCFGQRFYLAPSCDQIQTYRNAEFKREFGRACTGGRAQDCVPQASGPFVGADQGRHRDQQRHGTKGDGWVAQNPCCNRAPKCLIYRTPRGRILTAQNHPIVGSCPCLPLGNLQGVIPPKNTDKHGGEHEQSGLVMIRGKQRPNLRAAHVRVRIAENPGKTRVPEGLSSRYALKVKTEMWSNRSPEDARARAV